MNHYFLFVSFLFGFFCAQCAQKNKIFVIEIPLNASIQTPSRTFLEKLIPESTDFHGELQKHFKNSSDLLKRDIYCLSPFNGLSHAHLLIQSVFPIFKKVPYVPILYHLIPYLIYGEYIFSNTVEYVNRYFTKDSSIILLYNDYSCEEVAALASIFHKNKFENVELLNGFNFCRMRLKYHEYKIAPSPFAQALLNKQWWIEQFWFRCFLRFSRFSLGFIIFAFPFFMLRKKNF